MTFDVSSRSFLPRGLTSRPISVSLRLFVFELGARGLYETDRQTDGQTYEL